MATAPLHHTTLAGAEVVQPWRGSTPDPNAKAQPKGRGRGRVTGGERELAGERRALAGVDTLVTSRSNRDDAGTVGSTRASTAARAMIVVPRRRSSSPKTRTLRDMGERLELL